MHAACDAPAAGTDVDVVSADGTRLVARAVGRGEPVVFVHGSAGGLGSWDPLLPFLREDLALWTYARRGYAPSDDHEGEKRFVHDVADLRAVIEAAGPDVHLVGASHGATVALHAARDGTEVRSLVVFEPPLFSSGASLEPTLDRYRALVAAGDFGAASLLFAAEVARVPETMLAAMASGAGAPADAEQRAAQAAEAQGCLHDLEAMRSDGGGMRRFSAVEVPVLLMQGELTWSPMPETMDELAAALPGAQRVVLGGQAHFAPHTGPERFASELLRFFDRS
jgi:pimeloyl-ACP methyl ester carboxylesterase